MNVSQKDGVPAQDKLLHALMAARTKMDPVVKDRLAQVRSERGNYTYKYAGAASYVLEAVTALLAEGLVLTFDPEVLPGVQGVVKEATATTGAVMGEVGRKVKLTALLEHPESAQWRSMFLEMPLEKGGASMNIYQAIGAAATYGQGILTRCMLGMASTEDEQVEGGEEPEGRKNGAPDRPAVRPAQERQEIKTVPSERSPLASSTVLAKGDTLISVDNVDSYESAMQMLNEKVEVGGKEIPLFYIDADRQRLTTALKEAARDVGRMTLVYAEIQNAANTNRAKLEKGGKA